MNAQSSPKENFSTRANRRGKSIPYPTNRRPISTTLPASETGQRLSALFPNGWDWIYAAAPTADRKPEWTTVKKHPLTGIEQWSHHQNPAIVIGIRPNAITRWGILDIDKTSQYHPTQNPAALQIIRNALEDIGIVRTILNQSSHSGGLHLYIPLPEDVSSFWLSIALKYNLEASGIQIRSGQCELFPNPKKYIPEGQGFSHFNGIRMPMQPGTGFIPLDLDLNPLPWNLEDWLNAFDQAAAYQDPIKLNRQIKDAKENYKIRTYRDPESVDSWRERLHQEKLQGWTGSGQTNEKLKAFACEARVFLNMDSEQQIAEYIQKTAESTPGFHQYSNHTRDIGRRSREVAQWAMRYYWPLGAAPSRETGYHTPVSPIASFSYHQAKREAAQERIKEAIAQLQSQNNLSPLASERAKQIAQIGKVSQQTLYKSFNKPLWHPAHIATSTPVQPPKPSETLIQQDITLLNTKEPKNEKEEPPEPLLTGDFSLLFKYVGFVILYLLSGAVAALPLQGQRAAETAISTDIPLDRGVQGGETVPFAEEGPGLRSFGILKQSLSEPFQNKLAEYEHQTSFYPPKPNSETSPFAPPEQSSAPAPISESRFARLERIPEAPPIEGPLLRGFGSLKQSLPESFRAKLTQHERQGERDRQREQTRRALLQARQTGIPLPELNISLQQQSSLSSTPPIVAVQSLRSEQRSPNAAEKSEFEAWYVLAERFKLVSDFHWSDGEYWVEQKEEWHPYAELAGTFPVGYLQRHLGDIP